MEFEVGDILFLSFEGYDNYGGFNIEYVIKSKYVGRKNIISTETILYDVHNGHGPTIHMLDEFDILKILNDFNGRIINGR